MNTSSASPSGKSGERASSTTACTSTAELVARFARAAKACARARCNQPFVLCDTYLIPRPSLEGRLQEWRWHRRSGLRSGR
jgi:hypothetical protein